jgi:hypothetical protein
VARVVGGLPFEVVAVLLEGIEQCRDLAGDLEGVWVLAQPRVLVGEYGVVLDARHLVSMARSQYGFNTILTAGSGSS